jgi:hypothetical protein
MRGVRVGDVFEIDTPRGLAYFQYTFKHPDFGQLIRVLDGVFTARPKDIADLVRKAERFFVFFPLSAAAHRKIVRWVATFELPSRLHGMPSMRRPGGRTPSGKVLNWRIFNPMDESERLVASLSEEERNLSLIAIWNDTLLCERICSGWKPADES